MFNIKEASIKEIKLHLQNLNETSKKEMIPYLETDLRLGVKKLAKSIQSELLAADKERKRQQKMWTLEDELRKKGFLRIAGTDEAGRGPLAGPVVAAAVVLPRDLDCQDIKDSKLLSEKKRALLAQFIMMHALAYGIGMATVEEIDSYNILRASELAMMRASAQIGDISLLLIDGKNKPKVSCPTMSVVGGDNLCMSIAAASILAKVHRDQIMLEYDRRYPNYGFVHHKGYGTEAHYQAIKQYGILPIHRKSFDLNGKK